jgi:purine-binding chemotaxis protein CheW
MTAVHVRMRLGAEHYALPVENVREIVDAGDISPVPGASALVLGVRNLRGQVLPVFSLAALFGIPADERPARLVVAEAGTKRAGLAIDEVTDVGELPPASQAAESEFLSGSALDDGRLIGVIDVDRVFAALEEGAPR